MTPNEYLQRHDGVGQYIHWKICQHYNALHAKISYEHKPQKVIEGESATILWDFSIYTEKTVQTNKPHINIKDHKEKIRRLIDFSFPMYINISAKEFEKLSKYKDLQIEVERMWQLKTSIIPIAVGTLGLVKKGTAKHLEKIPGKQNLSETQKIVLTSTAHILIKALSI